MAQAAMRKAKGKENAVNLFSGFKTANGRCEGCERIVEIETGKVCRSYVNPDAKWKNGICNFATHVKPEIITTQIKVNPLKAAKRASKNNK